MIKYIETKKIGNKLHFTLNAAGREQVELMDHENMTDEQIFLELFEYQLCNGWEHVYPEKIGALTESIILQAALPDGHIYWCPEYMETDYAAALRNDGLIFTKAY